MLWEKVNTWEDGKQKYLVITKVIHIDINK